MFDDGAWLHVIKDIVSSASGKLKERWVNIQQRNGQPLDLETLAEFIFEEHTDFSLPELDKFLASIPRRQQLSKTKEFKAKPIALALDHLTIPTVNGSVNNDNRSFELAAVETWMENYFDNWLEYHLSSEQSCHSLKTLLVHYHMSAERWYTGRPERMSKMLLAVGEIWVAIHEIAVHHNPLLLGTLVIWPTTILRHEYFRQCPKLQERKEQIERSAQRDRDKKLKQFRELKAKYDAIMKKYDDMLCEKVLQVQHDVEYYVHTKNKCRRCALPAKSKKLKISPH
ncbi:hypothetical protein FVER53590_10124 [Fusarium verticillioides]|nr:hypothetical protein FVER53590_10124 [Fusarium verticillioides]